MVAVWIDASKILFFFVMAMIIVPYLFLRVCKRLHPVDWRLFVVPGIDCTLRGGNYPSIILAIKQEDCFLP